MVAKQHEHRHHDPNGQDEHDCTEWRFPQRAGKVAPFAKAGARQAIRGGPREEVEVNGAKGRGETAGKDGEDEKGKEAGIVATADAGIKEGAVMICRVANCQQENYLHMSMTTHQCSRRNCRTCDNG